MKIDKIETKIYLPNAIEKREISNEEIVEKINEIIDRINEITPKEILERKEYWW